MEIKGIEFKPNYSVMQLTTRDLEIALNKTLQPLDGYRSSRIKVVEGGMLRVQIAFSRGSKSIIKNKVAAIVKIDATYRLEDETRKELSPFLRKNEDIEIFELKDKLVVELDAGFVLYNLILKDDSETYIRNIGNIFDLGDIGLIQIFQFEKSEVEKLNKQKNFANKVSNYNNRYYNNNNQNNNYKHNNNYNNNNDHRHNNNKYNNNKHKQY